MERTDIVAAYEQVGTLSGSARPVRTSYRTVKRVIERRQAGEAFEAPPRQLSKSQKTDAVATVIADKVRATDGRLSAKRLLPLARTASYTGRPALAFPPWSTRARLWYSTCPPFPCER